MKLVLLTAVAATLTACRYQTVWAGAEFDKSGQYIRLAADEPLCGCLGLKNLSGRDIMLRAMLHGHELGLQVLPQAATIAVRFDWAGPDGADIYRLDGFDSDGRQMKLNEATAIEDNGWPWRVCAETTCQYGTLRMNMGENRR